MHRVWGIRLSGRFRKPPHPVSLPRKAGGEGAGDAAPRHRSSNPQKVLAAALVWLMGGTTCVRTMASEPVESSPSVERASDSSNDCPIAARGGLQVLYDFGQSSKGRDVLDTSGVGEPLNLRIADVQAIRRTIGSLQIVKPTVIRSERPATKLIEAVKQTGEITIEVWVEPAKIDQDGPARIVTVSKNGNARNVTLGQDGNRYDARLRTTSTSHNGIPSLASPKQTVKKSLTHVVYAHRRSGDTRLFLNGEPRGQEQIAGQLLDWDKSYRLALGNELSQDRPWVGKLHRVAIYNRALSEVEVKRHYQAGPEQKTPIPQAVATEQAGNGRLFQTRVAAIFAQHCLDCHDSASNEGGLDLSRRHGALAGADSGQVILPGNAEESLLWEAIESGSMPDGRAPLSDEDQAVVRAWIEAGADWPDEFIDPAVYAHGDDTRQLWLRRLTRQEYIDTVREAVGVDIEQDALRLLPPDARADGFSNTAYNLMVDLEHVEAYARLAELIVDRMDVVDFATQFHSGTKLIDNDMRALVAEMGKWIFRGPLEEHEIATYRGISTTVAATGGDYEESARYIIAAMLQSPRFIYRIEQQRGDGSRIPVQAHELAARISYIVWGAPPDRELIRAADAGELYDCKNIEAQLQRMLEHPLAVERSQEFLIEWLDLDRLANLQPNRDKYPQWSPELAEDMRAETLTFFTDVVWNQHRPLTDMLDAEFTYLTPRLAAHYGDLSRVARSAAKSAGDEQELVRVELDDVPGRGGLLTHGSVLTIGGDEASMVTRGLFVLHDLLFSVVGDPPPGLDTTPVPASPGRSRRAIASERVESESCGGCHSRFEPLAFGLERFDGLGSYHETDEHDNALRQDGQVLFPGTAEAVGYQTVGELMEMLSESDRVSECLTRKVTQFALGRPLIPDDLPALKQIHKTMLKNGGTYASLMKAIVMSELVQTTRTEPL